MSAAIRTIGIVVALAGLGWLAWTPVRSTYLNPRAELEQRRAGLSDEVARYRAGAEDHLRVTTGLQGYVDRTLGGDLETVDHELRTHLNRLGEEIGLEKLSVGTGRVRRMESPARSLPTFRAHRELREELDFVEVEASVTGEGSLDAALRLVHRLEREPWMKRIVQVRLQPRDNGERFVVTLRLVTLFLPGSAPARPLEAPPDPGGFDRYGQIAGRNPFRFAPAAAATPPPAPAPAPVNRHRQWVLTGVVSGPEGVEVWLLHAESGQSRRLNVGQQIEGVVLVSAGGDTAEFQIGDEHFMVPVGGPLSP